MMPLYRSTWTSREHPILGLEYETQKRSTIVTSELSIRKWEHWQKLSARMTQQLRKLSLNLSPNLTHDVQRHHHSSVKMTRQDSSCASLSLNTFISLDTFQHSMSHAHMQPRHFHLVPCIPQIRGSGSRDVVGAARVAFSTSPADVKQVSFTATP